MLKRLRIEYLRMRGKALTLSAAKKAFYADQILSQAEDELKESLDLAHEINRLEEEMQNG